MAKKKPEPLKETSSVRNIELILYPDSTKIEDVRKILEEASSIIKWAYILHDKDNKKPHYHLCINFEYSNKCSTVMNLFNVKLNQLARPVGTWKSMITYLIHANAKDKYQYDSTEVICNFDYKEETQTVDQRIMDVCNRIILGEISRKQAYLEVGYPYSVKTTRCINDAYRIYCERMEETRKMKVTLIYGKAGSGKTSAAKMYAKQTGKDMCISSSSNDPMQDYGGEKILIMDDVREDTFKLEDWLKLLDNYTGSSVKSRYNNKVFTGDEIILTTSVNPLTWFQGTGEERWQFFRRVNLVIEVTPKVLKMRSIRNKGFIRTETGYVELASVAIELPNPVLEYDLLDDEETSFVDSVADAFILATKKLKEDVNKQYTEMNKDFPNIHDDTGEYLKPVPKIEEQLKLKEDMK